MPEYVISGVEKATAVLGERLAGGVASNSSVTNEIEQERPDLTPNIVSIPMESPGILAPLGQGFLRVSGNAGLLKSGEGEGELAGQKLPSAYYTHFVLTSFPRRNYSNAALFNGEREIGASGEVALDASYARDVTPQVILEPAIKTGWREFKKIEGAATPVIRKLFNLEMYAHLTPVKVGSGSLLGGFDYSLLDIQGGLKQSGSLDRLTLNYIRPAFRGSIESILDFNGELVGSDRKAHNLLRIESLYRERLGENVVGSAGLTGHIGNTAKWDRQPTTSISSTGLGESRQGLYPVVILCWKPPFGGIINSSYQPRASFASYRSLMLEYPMIDSLSRGSTVEATNRFNIGYGTSITDNFRTAIRWEWLSERHRPFIAPNGANEWTVVTRRAFTNSIEISADAELPAGIGLGVRGGYIDATTNSTGFKNEAPFVSPWLGQVDFSFPLSRELVLAQEFEYCSSAPANFSGSVETSLQANWDVALRWKPRPDLTATVGVHNLLDRPVVYIPGYDAEQLNIWASLEWRGANPF